MRFAGGFKIRKNSAIEWAFFNKIRQLSDGITFFEFKINLDLFKGDHNPKLGIELLLLNWMIMEINFYNPNHIE
jgi:hypothetical protein